MKYVAFVFLTFLAFKVSAQGLVLKGTVRDTVDKKFLKNASIVLLHAKDSVLYKTTRSQEDGEFELSEVNKGNYILMIAYHNMQII
jgi:hypothetical protein